MRRKELFLKLSCIRPLFVWTKLAWDVRRLSLCKNRFQRVPSLHPLKNSPFSPGFSGQAALLWSLDTKAGSKPSLSTNAPIRET